MPIANRIALLSVLGCLGLLIAAFPAHAYDKAKANHFKLNHRFPDAEDYVPNEIIIKFRDNVTTTDLNNFNHQIQATAMNRGAAIAAFHSYYKTDPQGQPTLGWQRLHLAAGTTVPAMLSAANANALVEKAEPNYKVYAAYASSAPYDLTNTYTANSAFNDPYYTDGHSQWWINRTHGDQAKAAHYTFSGTSDVIVAVCDTGVYTSHPEFAGRCVAGYNACTPSASPDDDNIAIGGEVIHGHGTHSAGMITALANNSNGIAGTAWDAHIKLMPVKVLYWDGSGTTATLAAGISWADTHGADIINCSLGFYYTSSNVQQAVQTAQYHGKLIVAAAGNDAANMQVTGNAFFPACYPNVMSIAASQSEGLYTAYANWSEPAGLLTCMAPGGHLMNYYSLSTDPTPIPTYYGCDNGVNSTANNGGYSALDGTSFAAPQVSALAALLKLQVPSRTALQIRDLIVNTCDKDAEWVEIYDGAGNINIDRALAVAKIATITPTATPIATSTVTPTTTPLRLGSDEIRAFPQPAKDAMRVGFSSQGTTQITLEIFNTVGERVLHLEAKPYIVNGTSFVDVATKTVAPGVYYLRIKIEDATGVRTINKKIAIQH
jgi:subtilisin family serine protease